MIAIENVPVTEDEKEQVYNWISDILQDLHELSECVEPVSYTHLDVYKRQVCNRCVA